MNAPTRSFCGYGRVVFILLAAAFAVHSSARAAESELEKEFRLAKHGIQTQLKNKSREQRLEAVKKLEEFPVLDAAKLLLLSGMTSGDPEVRRASYETLLTFKDNEEIGLFLAVSVGKDLKRGAVDERTCGALGVLLASKNPTVEEKAEQLLDEAASTQNTSGLLLLVTLADVLGAEATQSSLDSLLKLSQMPLFPKHFAFRRAVTQGLLKVRQVEAVTAIVEMLPSLRGEVRSDIVRYLTAISGKQIGIDPVLWADWWKSSKATFKFPEKTQPLVTVKANAGPPGTNSYYGLQLLATRMVFVMDTSGSMRGARIEAAKRELIKAIMELPEATYFSVLVFNSRIAVWQAKLVPATSENKEAACRFVADQELGPATASYDALEAALTFDAEAIYFVTDGAPRGGKVTQPAQIVTLITKLNSLHRMTVNSIGIGVGADGNEFDTFLKALASSNYGQYIRLDE